MDRVFAWADVVAMGMATFMSAFHVIFFSLQPAAGHALDLTSPALLLESLYQVLLLTRLECSCMIQNVLKKGIPMLSESKYILQQWGSSGV